MRRILKAAWAPGSGRRGSLALLALLGMALGADLLASDLPLVARVDGQLWLVPCLTRPAALLREPAPELAGRAEFWLRTPVGVGPNQTMALSGEWEGQPPPWGPSARHWLGTDELGRDVAARLLHGARVTLVVALGTVVLALVVGTLLGTVAGVWGGVVDVLLSRAIEITAGFPALFFLIALMSTLRVASPWPVALVLGLTRWTELARLARTEALRLSRLEFVAAARAMGAGPWFVVFRHVLPNAVGPLSVVATASLGAAVLLESGLAFLGLSVAPPTASWGELLTQAQRTLVHPGAWWLAVFPGLAIAGTVLAAHGVSESLRRAFDEGS